jgi:peptidyl-prolyl cis-trans isomerase A (cyclophilin A)
VRKFSVVRFMATAMLGCALAGCASSKQSSSGADTTAAGSYSVLFDTTEGPVTVSVDRSLAPKGAQRLYELVKARYYDGARFYRVVPGFVVQWGAAANPAVTKKWNVDIPDDPVKTSNTRGTVAFATGGPDTRTTHLFINLGDNSRLDAMGFAPIGRVTNGMDAVDRIYPGYGEQPDQKQIAAKGNAYLQKEFPRLDYIKSARIIEGSQ